MELTGKCKEDFEIWFAHNYGMSTYDLRYWSEEDKFKCYSKFLDAFGVYIDIYKDFNNIWVFSVRDTEYGNFTSIAEAQMLAINKANEIYNA